MLLYHRVATLDRDPQGLAVTPQRFAEHLRCIGAHGVPMSLETMVEQARAGALPRGAVAVTFDDGYADNLLRAVPLLAAERVPATVFIATATLATGREFWWDELEHLLLECGPLPSRLQVRIGTYAAEWDLSAMASPGEARRRVYDDLCLRLRSVTGAIRDQALNELSALVARPRQVRASHRPLDPAEVAVLAAAPGITVGSHTHSHSSLAQLPADEQRREIAGARHQLERITGTPVTTFAYPFGGRADLSASTVAIARDQGVTIACAAAPDSVRPATDPLMVPRIIVRNWTAAEFRQRWAEWTAA